MIRVSMLHIPNFMSLKSTLQWSRPCLIPSFLSLLCCLLAPHLSPWFSLLEIACLPHPPRLMHCCVDAAAFGFSGPGHSFHAPFCIFSVLLWISETLPLLALQGYVYLSFDSPLAHTETVFSLRGSWKSAQRFTKEIQKKRKWLECFPQLFLETLGED